MTTVMAALDFETNFRLNRRSRHQMQILVIEAMKEGADPEALLSSAQKVIDERTKELDKLDYLLTWPTEKAQRRLKSSSFRRFSSSLHCVDQTISLPNSSRSG